jgi:hypothetical protein
MSTPAVVRFWSGHQNASLSQHSVVLLIGLPLGVRPEANFLTPSQGIDAVFVDITQDLQHLYMLSYQAPSGGAEFVSDAIAGPVGGRREPPACVEAELAKRKQACV